MFKFLKSKKGQGMVEYGLIICAVAIAAIIGLNALGKNNSNRTMEIADVLTNVEDEHEAESVAAKNAQSIKDYKNGVGSGNHGGGAGLGAFPSYGGSGITRKPTTNEDGTENTKDIIGTIDEDATNDAPVMNDNAPEGNRPPVASFYVSGGTTIGIGKDFRLYNTSTDPDGDAIVKEEWSGVPAGNKFTMVGQYEIKLRVADEWGNWSQWTTQIITVTNRKPVAVITVSPNFTDGDAFDKSQIFSWSSTSSYDPDGHSITREEWSGKQSQYQAGDHTVRLRVQDEYGEWSDWVEKSFSIFDGSKPIIVDGSISDAKNNAWTISDIMMQGADDIPELISTKDVYFRTTLTVTDDDRDAINAIQYRIDGNVQNTLYNVSSTASETQTVTSPTSNGVPTGNALSVGTHTLEIRVKDSSGAWSDWVGPVSLKVLNVKDDEDPDKPAVEYMTMDIYNFNTTSQTVTGGTRGPWNAGDFLIIPEDKTGAVIKAGEVMIDDVAIPSEFITTPDGVSGIKFSYATEGAHTLKARFQDENGVWSDWVTNNSFLIQRVNLLLVSNLYFCDYNCYEFSFSTNNSGGNINVNNVRIDNLSYVNLNNPPLIDFSSSIGSEISKINVKVNDTIIGSWNTFIEQEQSTDTTTYLIDDFSFFGNTTPITTTTPILLSLQVVDSAGNTSEWTNTVSISKETISPGYYITSVEKPVSKLRADGFVELYSMQDDMADYIALPTGKSISFGGNTYNGFYVNSNGAIHFGQATQTIKLSPTDTNTVNSIVLLSDWDIRSDVYYKVEETKVSVLFSYDYYGAGTTNSNMLVEINYDGSGKVYYLNSATAGATDSAFVKTSSGNYTMLTSNVLPNTAYSWSKNPNGTSPYYISTAISSTDASINSTVTTVDKPIYLVGSSFTGLQLIPNSVGIVYEFNVGRIVGTAKMTNKSTNEELIVNYTANGEWDYSYGERYYFNMAVSNPNLTAGTYMFELLSAKEGNDQGEELEKRTTPIEITLTERTFEITSMSYSETSDYDSLYLYTNNAADEKDQIELKINDIPYTKVDTVELAKTTPNSFFYEKTTNSNIQLKIYNRPFAEGSSLKINARVHINSSNIWTNWAETTTTKPKLTISSVNIANSFANNYSDIQVNLTNYNNRTIVNGRIIVDDEDVTNTNNSLTKNSSSMYYKRLGLLEPGNHTIKVLLRYKIGNSDTIYETEEFTKTYTMQNFMPTITGMSFSSSSTSYKQFTVRYTNSQNIKMYNPTFTVTNNNQDISAKVSKTTSNNYLNGTSATIKIDNSALTYGTNNISIKINFNTASSTTSTLLSTNVYNFSYTVAEPSISSITVTDDKTLTVNFSNPLNMTLNNAEVKIDNTLITSNIKTKTTTSTALTVSPITPGEHTIEVKLKLSDNKEITKTITYTMLNVTSNNSQLTHGNTTGSTDREYLQFTIFTPYAMTFTKEQFEVKLNDNIIPIYSLSIASSGSSSYATDVGTMKNSYSVRLYLNDFIYREGTNTITVKGIVNGKELNWTKTETNGDIGLIHQSVGVNTTTDTTKIEFKPYYNGNTYYRVKELKIKEYTNNNFTTISNTTTVQNSNKYNYYIGTTYSHAQFPSIAINDSTTNHFYGLTFITPWGTESAERRIVYTPRDDIWGFSTLAYQSNGEFKIKDLLAYSRVNTFPASKIELQIGETQYDFTSFYSNTITSSLNSSTTSSYKPYASTRIVESTNGPMITDPTPITATPKKNDSMGKVRVKYNDGTYSAWTDKTVTFQYPQLTNITEYNVESSLVNNEMAMEIKVSGTQLSAKEKFTPTITLDGENLQVFSTTCSGTSCSILVKQPDTGLYQRMTVSMSYKINGTTVTTNTVSMEDFIISTADNSQNTIPLTRTANVTFPTPTGNYTKLTGYFQENDNWFTENEDDMMRINLATPINFLGKSVTTISLNGGSIGFDDYDEWEYPPELSALTQTQIKRLAGRNQADSNSINFLPSAFHFSTSGITGEDSGVFYKETSDKVSIWYKNMVLHTTFSCSAAGVSGTSNCDTATNTMKDAPRFDVLVEINKNNGSGVIYFSDFNKDNNEKAQSLLDAQKSERTIFVKKSNQIYGYLEPWYSDSSAVNMDNIYSNTKVEWSMAENLQLPPTITNIRYERRDANNIDIYLDYVSNSTTKTVSAATLLTEDDTVSTTFTVVDNDTIKFENINAPINEKVTLFTYIEIDNLPSTTKTLNISEAPVVTNMTPTTNYEDTLSLQFDVSNSYNKTISDATLTIISRTNSQTISYNTKQKTVANDKIVFDLDLLPQDYYYISLTTAYTEYGNSFNTIPFATNYDLVLSDLDKKEGASGKYYLAQKSTYTAQSTSTTGYNTLFSSADDTYGTISLPANKKVHFANTTYDKVYVNSNGSIRFGTSVSAYGSNLAPTTSYTTNSIVWLGGYDLDSSAYYKIGTDKLEILYNYRRHGNGSYTSWAKIEINYLDGSGSIYYINGLPSGITAGSIYSFVRVDAYDNFIIYGKGTASDFNAQKYDWVKNPNPDFSEVEAGTTLENNIDYKMRETAYLAPSTSTTGYNTLFSNADDTYGTISLPSGKYIKFGSTSYSKVYVNSNGSIRFDGSTNARGSNLYPTASYTTNSIVWLGGYDLDSSAYYKIGTDKLEILYNYRQHSPGLYTNWVKIDIKYKDGTGTMSFIGSAISNLATSSAATFVRTTGNRYDAIIPQGKGTMDKYSNVTYAWDNQKGIEETPRITNVTFDAEKLISGRETTFTITTDKEIDSARMYIGDNFLFTDNLITVSENVYTTKAIIPKVENTSSLTLKIQVMNGQLKSYWKTLTIPYENSGTLTISNLNMEKTNIAIGTALKFSTDYAYSGTGNVNQVYARYITSSREYKMDSSDISISGNKITANIPLLKEISKSNGILYIMAKDSENSYSNMLSQEINIVDNTAPEITVIDTPSYETGRDGIPYRKPAVFTIHYTDVDGDEISNIYYKYKRNNTWSSETTLNMTNSNVEKIDKNTVKVTLYSIINATEEIEYSFAVKDSYNKSQYKNVSIKYLENTPIVLGELATDDVSTIGSRIDLTIPYSDIDNEDSLQTIYVYINGKETKEYNQAFTTADSAIRVRNLLMTEKGTVTISVKVRDKYNKLSNEVSKTITVQSSSSTILYSYNIATVGVNEPLTLNNIFYELAENAEGISAIKYSIDGSEPVEVNFEETIKDNKFSYSLNDVKFAEPIFEPKNIFIQIRDNLGNWSDSVRGEFVVGHSPEENTDFVYIGYLNLYTDFGLNNIGIGYDALEGSGVFKNISRIVLEIDGIEYPDIINYQSIDTSYLSANFNFTALDLPTDTYDVKVNMYTTSNQLFSYDLGKYQFYNFKREKVIITTGKTINSYTNTDFNIYGYLYTLDYPDYSDLGNFSLISSIDNVDNSKYSLTASEFSCTYDCSVRQIHLTGQVREEIDSTLNIKFKDNNTNEETNTITIPIKITDNEDEKIDTFKNISVRNKNKTLSGNAIRIGDITASFSLYTQNLTGRTVNSSGVKVYVDDNLMNLTTTPSIYKSTSNKYIYFNISNINFNYSEKGTHTIKLEVTDTDGKVATFTKEYNFVPDPTPELKITKPDGTDVTSETRISLPADNSNLVFSMSDDIDEDVIYTKKALMINELEYAFEDGMTVDFSKIKQGAYTVKLKVSTADETVYSKAYTVMDNGVNFLASSITDYENYTTINIPNNLYVFGKTYSRINVNALGIISTKPIVNNYVSDLSFNNIDYLSQYLVAAYTGDFNYGSGGSINNLYYKNFTDNLTLYFDAVDVFGSQIRYSISFYNKDIIKFTYYTIQNSTVTLKNAGVAYDKTSYVYTNSGGNNIKDYSTVTIDTYSMMSK